jgi:hypothetical protein
MIFFDSFGGSGFTWSGIKPGWLDSMGDGCWIHKWFFLLGVESVTWNNDGGTESFLADGNGMDMDLDNMRCVGKAVNQIRAQK